MRNFAVYDKDAPAIIAPSILAADFSRLGEEIKLIEQVADWVHIDVMDGHFVPNISFGTPIMESIRPLTRLPFDVHLMIEKPERYIESFANAGANLINVHAETSPHLHRTCQQIRELDLAVGVTLNPATPLSVLEEILPEVDMVLLMSVNPGFGGQRYIEAITDKIMRLRQMIDERGLKVHIQVDGGVSSKNIKTLWDAGANVFVAGSAVFKADDPVAEIKRMKALCMP